MHVRKSQDSLLRPFETSWLIADAIEHASVIYTRNAARLVRQHRFDGGPFVTAELVAHDSRNHGYSGTINPNWRQ
ncbi:hypothetical protein LMTR3_33475 [Bradyrhizobium sp. LMTR 3]|nr:hypothetical protein LMTR3_33475 [Bradyrhizobium sp. LMTR 3]